MTLLIDGNTKSPAFMYCAGEPVDVVKVDGTTVHVMLTSLLGFATSNPSEGFELVAYQDARFSDYIDNTWLAAKCYGSAGSRYTNTPGRWHDDWYYIPVSSSTASNYTTIELVFDSQPLVNVTMTDSSVIRRYLYQKFVYSATPISDPLGGSYKWFYAVHFELTEHPVSFERAAFSDALAFINWTRS